MLSTIRPPAADEKVGIGDVKAESLVGKTEIKKVSRSVETFGGVPQFEIRPYLSCDATERPKDNL